ncbi:MAG: hypothetical protein ACUVTL_01320 [Thermoproteota archaeon]
MLSAFVFPKKRLELLYLLQRNGYKVRMHSYEYIVRDRKIVSTIILSPEWNLVKIKCIRWNIEESLQATKRIGAMIRSLDPSVMIEIT